MGEKTVHLPSISCGHCVSAIKGEIGKLEGVSFVDGDENTKDVNIKWDAPVTWEKISETLNVIGYPAD